MFLIRLPLAITSLKSSAITRVNVGVVDQQPKHTPKKLQLKIVSFININLSRGSTVSKDACARGGLR
jgi:hypothetical protein